MDFSESVVYYDKHENNDEESENDQKDDPGIDNRENVVMNIGDRRPRLDYDSGDEKVELLDNNDGREVKDGADIPALPAENHKLRALIQLIRNEAIDCKEDKLTDPYIHGLLAGRKDEAWPVNKPRKFLIFAVNSESYKILSGAMCLYKIMYCSMRGTRAKKDEAIRLLRDVPECRVMLVVTPKDCAGLDLPWLSHIVFYHQVLDKNVESQVGARGQRLGRTHNLQIITLLNESEAAPENQRPAAPENQRPAAQENQVAAA